MENRTSTEPNDQYPPYYKIITAVLVLLMVFAMIISYFWNKNLRGTVENLDRKFTKQKMGKTTEKTQSIHGQSIGTK